MRLILVLALIGWQLRSDIGRVYPPASVPMLFSGSAASNTVGAGVVAQPGKEQASLVNQHNGHNYGDTAK